VVWSQRAECTRVFIPAPARCPDERASACPQYTKKRSVPNTLPKLKMTIDDCDNDDDKLNDNHHHSVIMIMITMTIRRTHQSLLVHEAAPRHIHKVAP
jgi:hypothetical protein